MKAVSDTRPVFFFNVGEVPDIPQFEVNNYVSQPEGTSEYKNLYKLQDTDNFVSTNAEGCGKLQKGISES